MKRNWNCWNVLSLLGISMAFAAPVSAQTFTFLTGDADSNAVNISSDGGSTYLNGWAGVYQGQLGSGSSAQTINLFCVDVNHDVSPGDTFTVDTSHYLTDAAGGTYTSGGNTYYNGGLASALTSGDFNATNYNSAQPASATNVSWSQRASEVAWLADQFQNANTFSGASGSAASSVNHTAVNLAIWDIVQDGGDGIAKGSVVTDSGGQTQYSSLVNYYETQAAQHSAYTSTTAYFVQAPLNDPGNSGTSHYQDFVYSTALPTPEAGTGIAMGVLFLGGLFLFRRRNSAVTLA